MGNEGNDDTVSVPRERSTTKLGSKYIYLNVI